MKFGDSLAPNNYNIQYFTLQIVPEALHSIILDVPIYFIVNGIQHFHTIVLPLSFVKSFVFHFKLRILNPLPSNSHPEMDKLNSMNLVMWA
jgi:hypothetical protein